MGCFPRPRKRRRRLTPDSAAQLPRALMHDTQWKSVCPLDGLKAGASTSGKSLDFDSSNPRFESWRPNQYKNAPKILESYAALSCRSLRVLGLALPRTFTRKYW